MWCPGVDIQGETDGQTGCLCDGMPSLEELIEACNPENFSTEFFRLEHDRSGTRLPKHWAAFGGIPGPDSQSFRADGSTPKEAVAELWLKLNGK